MNSDGDLVVINVNLVCLFFVLLVVDRPHLNFGVVDHRGNHVIALVRVVNVTDRIDSNDESLAKRRERTVRILSANIRRLVHINREVSVHHACLPVVVEQSVQPVV